MSGTFCDHGAMRRLLGTARELAMGEGGWSMIHICQPVFHPLGLSLQPPTTFLTLSYSVLFLQSYPSLSHVSYHVLNGQPEDCLPQEVFLGAAEDEDRGWCTDISAREQWVVTGKTVDGVGKQRFLSTDGGQLSPHYRVGASEVKGLGPSLGVL